MSSTRKTRSFDEIRTYKVVLIPTGDDIPEGTVLDPIEVRLGYRHGAAPDPLSDAAADEAYRRAVTLEKRWNHTPKGRRFDPDAVLWVNAVRFCIDCRTPIPADDDGRRCTPCSFDGDTGDAVTIDQL
jgi:hypothetical protein